jgi:hypothetical protein
MTTILILQVEVGYTQMIPIATKLLRNNPGIRNLVVRSGTVVHWKNGNSSDLRDFRDAIQTHPGLQTLDVEMEGTRGTQVYELIPEQAPPLLAKLVVNMGNIYGDSTGREYRDKMDERLSKLIMNAPNLVHIIIRNMTSGFRYTGKLHPERLRNLETLVLTGVAIPGLEDLLKHVFREDNRMIELGYDPPTEHIQPVNLRPLLEVITLPKCNIRKLDIGTRFSYRRREDEAHISDDFCRTVRSRTVIRELTGDYTHLNGRFVEALDSETFKSVLALLSSMALPAVAVEARDGGVPPWPELVWDLMGMMGGTHHMEGLVELSNRD